MGKTSEHGGPKKRDSNKMKLISAFCAVAMGTRMSLIAGVEQGLCNGKDMCGDGHASICMRVTQEAIDYFGSRVGKIGKERCSCIFQHRWHMSQGRNFEVVGSKSPECGYKVLTSYKMGGKTYQGMEMLNLVEAGVIPREDIKLASDANSDGRCAKGYRGK